MALNVKRHSVVPQLYMQPTPHGAVVLGVTLFGQNGVVALQSTRERPVLASTVNVHRD
jgi:hypothetical protein